MFLIGLDVANYIIGHESRAVQPAGVDLSIGEVRELDSEGVLDLESKVLPSGKIVEPGEDGFYYLGRGVYRVRFKEIVSIPLWAIGFCLPRSSLIRMGAALHCAVWDPGYMGRGEALLAVLNPWGVRIRHGARIAQLVMARLERVPPKGYEGSYLFEGI